MKRVLFGCVTVLCGRNSRGFQNHKNGEKLILKLLVFASFHKQ